MAKTYNLRALSVKQSKFGNNGHRIPSCNRDDDEIVILYNENKIKKNDIVKSVQNGGIDLADVLCINKAMAEQLAD